MVNGVDIAIFGVPKTVFGKECGFSQFWCLKIGVEGDFTDQIMLLKTAQNMGWRIKSSLGRDGP